MLHERIRAHLQHRSLADAMRLAIDETVAAANARLRRREELDSVLTDLELIDIAGIEQHVRLVQRKFGVMLPPPGLLQIVMPGDDIEGIPSASCIAAHLPKDRPPTADEIREAWRRCTP